MKINKISPAIIAEINSICAEREQEQKQEARVIHRQKLISRHCPNCGESTIVLLTLNNSSVVCCEKCQCPLRKFVENEPARRAWGITDGD